MAVDPVKAAEVDAAIRQLDTEMPDLQRRYRDIFSYANAWAERYDAVLALTPEDLMDSVEARLNRIGVRWGVANGTRLTAQFPAVIAPG